MKKRPATTGRTRDEAFAEYVLPEVEVLLRVATTLTVQPADAEDLVQDTLLRAYQAVDRFDGRHARAWLLTILRRTEINRQRGRRPFLLDDPDAGLERVAVPPAAAGASPEEIVVGEMFDATVDQVLATLPVSFRQVVRLVDVDGLSYAETAKVLGVPKGTVMSRLHRARRRIRERLEEAGLTGARSV